MDGLSEEDEMLKEFAIGGICNCICGKTIDCNQSLDDFLTSRTELCKADCGG